MAYKRRFAESVEHLLKKFDSDRAEEVRFNGYWQESLAEIVKKHI